VFAVGRVLEPLGEAALYIATEQGFFYQGDQQEIVEEPKSGDVRPFG